MHGAEKNIFTLEVNYDLSVEEAIKAGRYDHYDGNINGYNFPSSRKGKAEIEIILLHFNHRGDIGADEVFREMEKQGLRAAELPELLAFGAKYNKVQCKFPVAALGSVWENIRRHDVAVLYGKPFGARHLERGCLESSWYPFFRFAAIRK
ncbi:MAG: hypothetical protein M1334_04670 [Patescibacteria group bacterium]|nr:hypothetical protein [Patescibacteria group bacterium]